VSAQGINSRKANPHLPPLPKKGRGDPTAQTHNHLQACATAHHAASTFVNF